MRCPGPFRGPSPVFGGGRAGTGAKSYHRCGGTGEPGAAPDHIEKGSHRFVGNGAIPFLTFSHEI